MATSLRHYLGQIRALPDLLPPMVLETERRVRQVLSIPEIFGIREIVLTGSGDSHIAALAAASAIRAWTGLAVQPMVSMEASRYLGSADGRLTSRLVICISHSGEAARTVEAAERLAKSGALTLAVTANGGSRLGRAARRVLDVAGPAAAAAPGAGSYIASLLGLYLLGIRIGEVRMRFTMAEADALRKRITDFAAPLAAAIPFCEEPLAACATAWRGMRAADVLGSGPGFGSASYMAAKLVEAAGIHAAAQDIEEFFHLNYFIAAPEATPAIVFAPARAASAGRAAELIATLGELGRPHLIVSDDASFAPQNHTLALPTVDEWLAPVLHVIPAALLAVSWADRSEAVHFRGHAGPWRSSEGAGLVRNSRIES